jgi:hypothetical protein
MWPAYIALQKQSIQRFPKRAAAIPAIQPVVKYAAKAAEGGLNLNG